VLLCFGSLLRSVAHASLRLIPVAVHPVNQFVALMRLIEIYV